MYGSASKYGKIVLMKLHTESVSADAYRQDKHLCNTSTKAVRPTSAEDGPDLSRCRLTRTGKLSNPYWPVVFLHLFHVGLRRKHDPPVLMTFPSVTERDVTREW